MRPVLFLGCSLNQDRTVDILKRVAGNVRLSRHYAVVQKPAAPADYQKRAMYLASRNIRPIWYSEGDHAKVAGLLRYLAGQVPAHLRRTAQRPGTATSPAAEKPDSIPRPLTPFIGREQERKDFADLLQRKRLLTITGSPGSGKTRVAIEVARSARPDFDSVWFVELSQLQDEDLVPQRVATVLGIREQVPRPPTEVIAEFLRTGKFLVVLDNCEHLITVCASLADYLVRECPQLTILATSRRFLNVPGEHLFPMPPLETPDPDRVPPVRDLALIDSVELLLERAQARSNFNLTEQNARSVAALCQRLEGIPLALELAAAQLDTLTVDQILTHLHQRLELLTGGGGGTAERQWATLTEAVNFSHDLLDDQQTVLFRRVSIFHRGWTWEAAAAICRDPEQNEFAVLRLLNQLHGMSLVAVEEINGQKRFRLLDFTREYAQNKLREANEEAVLADRHAAWYVTLAEKAAPELLKKDQAHWLNTLAAEADNLRAAIEWATLNRKTETALRLTGSLWRLMEIRGYYREGSERLKRALDINDAARFPALRSKALSGLSLLAYR